MVERNDTIILYRHKGQWWREFPALGRIHPTYKHADQCPEEKIRHLTLGLFPGAQVQFMEDKPDDQDRLG